MYALKNQVEPPPSCRANNIRRRVAPGWRIPSPSFYVELDFKSQFETSRAATRPPASPMPSPARLGSGVAAIRRPPFAR